MVGESRANEYKFTTNKDCNHLVEVLPLLRRLTRSLRWQSGPRHLLPVESTFSLPTLFIDLRPVCASTAPTVYNKCSPLSADTVKITTTRQLANCQLQGPLEISSKDERRSWNSLPPLYLTVCLLVWKNWTPLSFSLTRLTWWLCSCTIRLDAIQKIALYVLPLAVLFVIRRSLSCSFIFSSSISGLPCRFLIAFILTSLHFIFVYFHQPFLFFQHRHEPQLLLTPEQ